jgi:hypothetical protein
MCLFSYTRREVRGGPDSHLQRWFSGAPVKKSSIEASEERGEISPLSSLASEMVNAAQQLGESFTIPFSLLTAQEFITGIRKRQIPQMKFTCSCPAATP